jgi:hypothetical protein
VSPWFAIRNLPLFPIAALVIASEHIASAWERIGPSDPQRRRVHPLASLLGLLLAGALLVLAHLQGLQRIKIGLAVPAASVALLKESSVEGNLAVNFNWGGYAIWHLGPRIKVSIDGRYDSIYSQKNLFQNGQFMQGLGDWDALVEENNTEMALVRKVDAINNLLRLDPDWVLVYSDEYSALFVRSDSRALGPLRLSAASFSPPAPTGYFP